MKYFIQIVMIVPFPVVDEFEGIGFLHVIVAPITIIYTTIHVCVIFTVPLG